MIEMSRLTAQNNNCASVQQESSSGSAAREESHSDSRERGGSKNPDKGKHSKVSLENISSGENYV